MGWVELISLMRKLLPLLSRVVPMLESTIAARSANRAESAALDSASSPIGRDIKELGIITAALLRTQQKQALQIEGVSESVQQAASLQEVYADRVRELDERVASLFTWIKTAVALSAVALLAVVILLTVMWYVGRASV